MAKTMLLTVLLLVIRIVAVVMRIMFRITVVRRMLAITMVIYWLERRNFASCNDHSLALGLHVAAQTQSLV